MKLSELANEIIENWAKPKGLCDRTQAQALAQHSKTEEEVGELLAEIQSYESWTHTVGFDGLKPARDRIKIEAGDVLVTLIIQCEIQGYSIKDALILVQYQPDFPISYYVRAMRGWIEADGVKTVKLEMGVIAIALEKLIKPYNLTLLECLEAAWEKIRDRTGQTIDGVFVKSEDLPSA